MRERLKVRWDGPGYVERKEMSTITQRLALYNEPYNEPGILDTY